jgi:condensin complex subunit 3
MGTDLGVTPATARLAGSPVFKKKPEDRIPEEKARADEIDLRCLSLCIGVLERVNSVRSTIIAELH